MTSDKPSGDLESIPQQAKTLKAASDIECGTQVPPSTVTVTPVSFAQNSSNSVAGNENAPKTATKGKTNVNTNDIKIRQWLIDLVPDIDAPSLNALAKLFENDGVLTMGNVKNCIRVGVLETSDIKAYINAVGLQKMKGVEILKAVQSIAAGAQA